MGRWIKIYDKFLQWEWFGKAEMVQLFAYFLLKANDKPKHWQGITVGRGQFVTTNAAIRRDLNLSEQKIRTCLKRLIATGEITYKSTNKYVTVTICNYDRYQSSESSINEQNNEQTTSNCRSNNAKINDNIRIKNKDNKETSLTRGKEIAAAVAAPTSASDEAEAPKPIKTEKKEAVPFTKIKDLWNEVCIGYPRLVKISDSRKNKISNRVTDMGGVEKALPMLRQIFTKMQASNFLRGDNKRGWKASFDWLFENDKNWVKVYEGNYDNRLDPVPRYRTNNINNGKNCNDEWK